jgi:ComF family protein
VFPTPLHRALRAVAFSLLPPHCLLCGQDGATERDLCDACAADLVHNATACARCALPLATAAALCGDCLRHPPPFDAAFVPFVYASPLDRLLLRLKFGRNLAAGRVLTELWCAHGSAAPLPLPQALIPVPLHAQRLRERGFNQALELARPLARAFGVPLAAEALVCVRATAPQSELDAKARRRNLRGAFALAPDVKLPPHVALLDDVMTTGATLRAAAATLRRAGVQRIDVWACARAPPLRRR